MDSITVTMADVRAARLCSGGARKFFERYGLSYTDFLKKGISARLLCDTGDALALHAVEAAKRRVAQGG